MLDARKWSPNAYRAISVPTGARGRPRFQIKLSLARDKDIVLKSGPR